MNEFFSLHDFFYFFVFSAVIYLIYLIYLFIRFALDKRIDDAISNFHDRLIIKDKGCETLCRDEQDKSDRIVLRNNRSLTALDAVYFSDDFPPIVDCRYFDCVERYCMHMKEYDDPRCSVISCPRLDRRIHDVFVPFFEYSE